MTRISLSGADFADLAAGLIFNTLVEDGAEIILDGRDFDDGEIAVLATGDEVEYQGPGGTYTISAPEAPWAGHRLP